MGAYSRATDDPWRVRAEEFPAEAMPEEQIRFLLNYAVLAPSSQNTQPWLFRISGDQVSVIADRRRGLPVIDPDDRQLVMSCGSALYHLRMAAYGFGFEPVVHTFPDMREPDLLATVRLVPLDSVDERYRSRFAAIKSRRTCRKGFSERAVSKALVEGLVDAASEEGVRLVPINDVAQRETLADLITSADRLQGADRRFRRELAAWLHPNRSQSRDGIPGYGVGLGDAMSIAGPLVVRTFDWGRGRAARDLELLDGSPVLAVLATDGDSTPAWLSAGQALDAVLLEAASHGIAASFMNQPIEVDELRLKVAELVGEKSPQLILRMGYGPRVRATPRRPIADVLARPGFTA